jgi:hypothetical protein
MLARRREQIIVIVGLIGVNVLFGWVLERLGKDYRSRTQWLYVDAPAQPSSTLASAHPKVVPQSFVEIVDRNVFSSLRGSRPPQAEEAAKAPPLPILFGTMDLGSGRFALMAPGGPSQAVSKRVLPGEEVGDWKLVSINASTVVVEWHDTKNTLEISGAARRSPGMVEKTASAAARPAAITTAGAPLSSGAANPSLLGSTAFKPAKPTTPEVPVGTVVDGKRKGLTSSPFGMKVTWEDVGGPGSGSPNQTGGPNK